MKNLIFSLNATVPVFLLMALGFLFRKLGWLDEVFASKMNQFVFLVPLPLLVFEDLASVDFQKVWNLKFVFILFLRDSCKHCSCRYTFVIMEGQGNKRRVYTGVIQKQHGASWDRIHPKYIRRCGSGASYDHRKRAVI
mgnify:CR=1 FL=1